MQLCPQCGEENPSRFRLCGMCGAELAPKPRAVEGRKVVTVVFSDLVGSTALGERLDPESLREVMSRYFEEMRAVLEQHGSVVEKYIGDAIMAVFGLAQAHEDDALRAVRAASAMRTALAELNRELETRWGVTLVNRTGVNTGEVIAGDPATGQRLVTGDAVNVAARLEQAAPGLGVLIGGSTFKLVSGWVEASPVEPLTLKGKADPVPAYLLEATLDRRAAGTTDVPLVGREQELRALRLAFDDARRRGVCRLVAVLGEAGMGKSRLTDEFARSVGEEALVLKGRCLQYGRGITFWPLVEAVRQAAGIRDDEPAERALEKLLAAAGGDREIMVRIAAAIGLEPAQFAVEDLIWATRTLFERLASDRPLVVVWDDLHWAEETFLDLVEQLTRVDSVPILLLVTARPDLLERRSWGDVDGHATLLELEPLSAGASAGIVAALPGGAELGEAVLARVVQAAAGNPLFVEQLASMLIEDESLHAGDGSTRAPGAVDTLAIPPTIQALLAARLDQLGVSERTVIETASVIGLVFRTDALSELVPPELERTLPSLVDSLVRRQLVMPAADGGHVRFRHTLIRDAAYQGMLKRQRATLHEGFVGWAERVNANQDRGAEYEEILGYHLEQAHRYLGELGPLDAHATELGIRGGERLGSAGRRAFGRADMAAAANLLERAAALFPSADERRIALLPELAEAWMDTGAFASAEPLLDEAAAEVAAAGNVELDADIRLTRLLVRHHSAVELEAWRLEVERETQQLLPLLEGRHADALLAKAWRLRGYVHATICRYGEAAEAVAHAIAHARRAGDARQEARNASSYTLAALNGPMPAADAIARCEELLANGLADRQAEALILCSLAQLYAMRAEFDRARELYGDARARLVDLGVGVIAASTSLDTAPVEFLAADPAAAERDLRRDREALQKMGERYLLPVVLGLLARAVCLQARAAEALELADEAQALAAPDDVEAQALVRGVRGRALAELGRHDEAERYGRESVDLLRRTDSPVRLGDALLDLAEVLRGAGKLAEARPAALEAAELFEHKGNVVGGRRARELVEAVDLELAAGLVR